MIAALIPVKRLREAKTRLAGALGAEEREAVVLALLERTVAAILESGVIARLAVTTPERELAETVSAEWVPDAGSLNASLQAGVRWAIAAGAEALLIVPADLPLIQPADIAAVVNASNVRPGIAIAPCDDGGTGALLLRPPDIIAPAFGPDSYDRHREAAIRARVAVRIVTRDGLSRDLDTEADLTALRGTLLGTTLS